MAEIVAWRVSFNQGKTWTIYEWDPTGKVENAIIRPLVEATDASYTPLDIRQLDSIGHFYFDGPLNSNERMFGEAVERVVIRRLLAARCRVATAECPIGVNAPGLCSAATCAKCVEGHEGIAGVPKLDGEGF